LHADRWLEPRPPHPMISTSCCPHSFSNRLPPTLPVVSCCSCDPSAVCRECCGGVRAAGREKGLKVHDWKLCDDGTVRRHRVQVEGLLLLADKCGTMHGGGRQISGLCHGPRAQCRLERLRPLGMPPSFLLRNASVPASQMCVLPPPVSTKKKFCAWPSSSISSHVFSNVFYSCAPTCRCLPCARPSEVPSSRQSRATSGAPPSAQCPTRHPPALTTQTVKRYRRPAPSLLFRIVANRRSDANKPPTPHCSFLLFVSFELVYHL
jgi:hypothetical protein